MDNVTITAELLSAMDKLGAVGVLVLVLAFQFWKSKQDQKFVSEKIDSFIDAEKRKAEALNLTLQSISKLVEDTKENSIRNRELIKDVDTKIQLLARDIATKDTYGH